MPLFKPTPTNASATPETLAPWLVLIVDDEPAVHTVTRLALTDLRYQGRGVSFLQAVTAVEAQALVARHPDIALAFVDVVMEHETAGLELVQLIRSLPGRSALRLVLRTGQPGRAPERQVINDYDIDTYLDKATLSSDRLYASALAGLRAYERLLELECANAGLAQHRDALEERVRERTAELEAAREKAEQLATAKTRFLSLMSHELRTPMNGLIGFSDLLADSELDDDQRALVLGLTASAQRLNATLNDIIDYADIDSSTLSFAPEPFDLKELGDLARVYATLRAQAKGVRFVSSGFPATEYLVHADRKRLVQIVTNLLDNAIKFTAAGEVGLSAELPPNGEPEGVLRLTVSDSGIGIAQEKIPLLFEPFSQVDDSQRRRFEGTGLGLAICARLAQMMGGSLTVESTPGQGSRFTLALPMPAGIPEEN